MHFRGPSCYTIKTCSHVRIHAFKKLGLGNETFLFIEKTGVREELKS